MHDILVTGLLLTAITLVLKFVLLMRTRWKFQRALKCFPEHPNGVFFLGHAKAMLEGVGGVLAVWDPVYKNNETAMQAWITPFTPGVVVYHSDTIKALFNSSEPKDWSYFIFEDWIGDGLLLSNGRKWARNRRLLTPAFHFEILKPYVSVFVKSTERLVAKWEQQCQDKACSIDVDKDLGLTTLDSLLLCIMGKDGDVQNGRKHPYKDANEILLEHIVVRFSSLIYRFDIPFALSPEGFKHRKALNVAHGYSSKVIADRREALKKDEIDTSKGALLPFIDILLKAKDESGAGLSDQEIRDEVDTFMFEGHDTTASGLQWIVYNLANNPEMQETCRKEVNTIMEKREDGELKWADLSEFEYLTKFIKESMRIDSPVPGVSRRLENDLSLPDGRVIPKGMTVYCYIYGVHHNPNIWKDPNVFDPERFSPENSAGRSPYAFVPFAAGSRNCIGQHFAMAELKSVTAILLRHFRFDIDSKTPVQRIARAVLKSTNGVHIMVSSLKC